MSMASVLGALWLKLPRQVRYVLVGGLNTAFGYGLFALCYLGLRAWWPYVAILVLAHVLAVSFSFATHSRWVFGDERAWTRSALARAWLRFQVSYLGLLGLGLLVNFGVLSWVSDSVWFAQAVATGVGVLVGYLVHRYLVFHRPNAWTASSR